MSRLRASAAAVVALVLGSCGKVNIFDVAAGFIISDASWFAEEETMFVFYDVSALQGIGDPSVIEITYVTDDERVDWTPVDDFETVHTHLPVDCGTTSLCGSVSIHVEEEPRDVDIRLRYHVDGELALEADTVFNVVGPGPAHLNRSLVIYGVFDESNTWIQWRARHEFPTLRNEEAQFYGLRRYFAIEDQRYGDLGFSDDSGVGTRNNPYGYGVDCSSLFAPAFDSTAALTTWERAIFNYEQLPTSASEEEAVCSQATVVDATGTFVTTAYARKNAEVRPAFPELRSPIVEATPVKFFLEPCDRNISQDHETMQRQRLQMEGTSSTCIDDWNSPGFADSLAVKFQDAIEDERAAGNDMVLVVGLHRDQDGVVPVVEDALMQVVPEERHRGSPRVAGAFVFDSEIRGLDEPELEQSTLWCPASIPDGTDIPDTSELTCAILPDNPELNLGPFSFSQLPILPDRDQYLDFIVDYSKAQAGSVEELAYLTPEFATTTDHADLGEFGVLTFLSDEYIATQPDDAFSYCVNDEELNFFVFRSDLLQSDIVQQAIQEQCDSGQLDETFCLYATQGILPIESIGEWHAQTLESQYELGVYWDFPFLLRMTYESVAAGSAGAFGLCVPFGFRSTGEGLYGSAMWLEDTFPMEKTLTQCTRFCDYPTFDSAGVYQVMDSFRSDYATTCYGPDFPAPGDSGFPSDP